MDGRQKQKTVFIEIFDCWKCGILVATVDLGVFLKHEEAKFGFCVVRSGK